MLAGWGTSDVARARHGWAFGMHLLPHGFSVYAHFPGDPADGQPCQWRSDVRPRGVDAVHYHSAVYSGVCDSMVVIE